MATYRVAEKTVQAGDAALNDILAVAYTGKARPTCLCRTPPVEMYIAKVAGRFLLKRMPNTGGDHSPACDSYEPPSELSGLGQVMGSAIQENADDGLTTLKLNFSLTKVAGRAAPVAGGAEKDSVKTDGTKLTLRGTLHYLWEQAGFNRWSPLMSGKRSWYVVRKFLMHAAENKVAKGSSISDILYIPESFSIDKKDEIAQRRMNVMRKVSVPSKEKRQLILTIGEIKDISAARNGFKLKFKHVGDCDFMMNEDIQKRLSKRFSKELELWDAYDSSHLIAITTVSVSTTGVPSVEEIALMNVDENWIPFESAEDKMLIDRLVGQKRRFMKGLRYNMVSDKPLACAVLSDTSPNPTGMYIRPISATEEYSAELQLLTDESKLDNWIWLAGEAEMPALPPVAGHN